MYSSLDTAVTILGPAGTMDKKVNSFYEKGVCLFENIQAGNIHRDIRCRIMAFCRTIFDAMDKKTVNGNTGYAALPGIEAGRERSNS